MLWQLQLSHYNEKVRWALDHKRIPHVRRSLLPGLHRLQAQRLTGDTVTTPVLSFDGRSIGDSSRILAAIEQHWPQAPLYPEDETQRRRALELEEFFDEELGPHIRRALYHELLPDPNLAVPLFTNGQRLPARVLVQVTFPLVRVGIRRTLKIDPEAAKRSRERTVAAMDRLESEIGPGGYLVGDSFTVADLTAAALFYPVARPPEFPYPTVTDPPRPARDFLDSLLERPGGQWVAEIYRRHRSPQVTSTAAQARVQ